MVGSPSPPGCKLRGRPWGLTTVQVEAQPRQDGQPACDPGQPATHAHSRSWLCSPWVSSSGSPWGRCVCPTGAHTGGSQHPHSWSPRPGCPGQECSPRLICGDPTATPCTLPSIPPPGLTPTPGRSSAGPCSQKFWLLGPSGASLPGKGMGCCVGAWAFPHPRAEQEGEVWSGWGSLLWGGREACGRGRPPASCV